MPDGVFSMYHGSGSTVGQALIKHASIKAAGFTGSRSAGRLLFDLACQRDEPIPFFAEMGSINPIVILPNAMNERPKEIAGLIAGSITLGAGQFCTNPGLLLIIEKKGYSNFLDELNDAISTIAPSVMLNEKIHKSFETDKYSALNQKGVKIEAVSRHEITGDNLAMPTLASVNAASFFRNSSLSDEIFGPYSLIVKCKNENELEDIVGTLEGQLTATIFAADKENEDYGSIINQLKNRVGRIIFNGVPTGVEVCGSMQHGGPYPASGDVRFTSVGTSSIKRFPRPIAFQDWPEYELPDELKNSNPLNIWRWVDNYLTKENS
jgi:NADP-dependent aldehyde dehydrogenase